TSGLAQIFQNLKRKNYVDFSQYKPSTIRRRISRRMSVLRIERLNDYATYLESHPEEINALFAEILIHVTEFFRDGKAFEVFSKRILPNYLREKDSGLPFRVWVPGCSTGEEAYSIAISLLEHFGDLSIPIQINIFATDVSESALPMLERS
ncbi:MAG: CheR family methyltransferase, partial [Bdellovibrionia bacterium]